MSFLKQIGAMVAGFALLSAGAAFGEAAGDGADPETITYRIYVDADQTVAAEAGRAIEMGLRAALSDLDPKSIIPGKKVAIEVAVRDHRTNVFRSKLHMDEFLADPRGLVFFGGVHSPQLIRYREYLNENGVLTLVPWAAGAPVTRAPTEENWIFRLSVDDRKAGVEIARYAVLDRGCEDVHLLLTDNPWGKSNARTLSAGLELYDRHPTSLHWMPWQADLKMLRQIVSRLRTTSADCLIAVGDSVQAKSLIDALLELPRDTRPSVLSHWGITTSDFPFQAPASYRDAVGLKFVQSCHDLFADTPEHHRALASLKKLGGGAHWAGPEIPAPPGFVHAYDLTKLLLAAMRQARLTGEVRADRAAIRAALQKLDAPVLGLIKTYRRPFEPYSPDKPDAHEALGLSEMCMAQYDVDNVVRVDLRAFANQEPRP